MESEKKQRWNVKQFDMEILKAFGADADEPKKKISPKKATERKRLKKDKIDHSRKYGIFVTKIITE